MQYAARVGATKTIAGSLNAIVTASVYTVKPTLHVMDMPFQVCPSVRFAAFRGGNGCQRLDLHGERCAVEELRLYSGKRGDGTVRQTCKWTLLFSVRGSYAALPPYPCVGRRVSGPRLDRLTAFRIGSIHSWSRSEPPFYVYRQTGLHSGLLPRASTLRRKDYRHEPHALDAGFLFMRPRDFRFPRLPPTSTSQQSSMPAKSTRSSDCCRSTIRTSSPCRRG